MMQKAAAAQKPRNSASRKPQLFEVQDRRHREGCDAELVDLLPPGHERPQQAVVSGLPGARGERDITRVGLVEMPSGLDDDADHHDAAEGEARRDTALPAENEPQAEKTQRNETVRDFRIDQKRHQQPGDETVRDLGSARRDDGLDVQQEQQNEYTPANAIVPLAHGNLGRRVSGHERRRDQQQHVKADEKSYVIVKTAGQHVDRDRRCCDEHQGERRRHGRTVITADHQTEVRQHETQCAERSLEVYMRHLPVRQTIGAVDENEDVLRHRRHERLPGNEQGGGQHDRESRHRDGDDHSVVCSRLRVGSKQHMHREPHRVSHHDVSSCQQNPALLPKPWFVSRRT
jgi:hypothetical protein